MKTANKKRPIEKYFETHDPKYIAEDAVFIHMENGNITVGREAISAMLTNMYTKAFDAHAEIRNTVVCNNQAVLEAEFIGKHIGEFAGISPTGKNVKTPICVSYDLQNELIKTARVYISMKNIVHQISSKE